MLVARETLEKKDALNTLVAVAVDKDKGSQSALKWAVDHLLVKGQTIVLIHVKVKHPSSYSSTSTSSSGAQTKEIFLPFRCFCTRKYIQCKDVVLEDADISKALIGYVTESAIQILIMGAASKGGFLRFSKVDVPTTVSKGAPDFCTVYTISKGKISSVRSASKPAPQTSSLREEVINSQANTIPVSPSQTLKSNERLSVTSNERLSVTSNERLSVGTPSRAHDDMDFRSPFVKGGGRHQQLKSYGDLSLDSDISFVSCGRPSYDHNSFYDIDESSGRSQNRLSTSSDTSGDFPFDVASRRSVDSSIGTDFSVISDEVSNMSWSSSQPEDVEAEMRRLRNEIKQTTDMYTGARKGALLAKQKAMELKRWKLEEQRKSEEEAMEKEKEKPTPKVVVEAAEASQRIAEIEAQKRLHIEIKALKEANEEDNLMDSLGSDIRYRRYTIEEIEVATEYFSPSRKIGEGGYGPVFKGRLDHTPVAIKVLRPDAAQGRSQFHQEIQVLSCIRHPHMVLLLGASPEYGCIVYEYMQNGSLDDRLFCKDGTPPIPWQHRFRIAAEIASCLLFLHQTKPEPLVHRDLKPGNILLDRNLVSKIGDVGLARLVPPTVADSVTQYRMTSTAGTFCYIDPEYQQTGMLGVKSDVYSLGILLLQIITAKSPMGLTHQVESALENGTFEDILDPAVHDWPIEEAKSFAEIALKCAELRRKDRPDLGSVVLQELDRLRVIAEESLDVQGWH